MDIAYTSFFVFRSTPSSSCKSFSHFKAASFSLSNDYRLQRHRHKALQDVVLMTFVIWNSCVSFRKKRGVRGGKFFPLCVNCLHFADFSSRSSSYLFTTRDFGFVSTAETQGGRWKNTGKKLLRRGKERGALSIFFFHFTLFVFRQI